jgi:undecaprenyl-diphosphatase
MISAFAQSVSQLDRTAMLWVRERHSRSLTSVLKCFSYSGTGKVWFSVAIVLALLDRQGVHVVPAQSVFLKALLAALAAWVIGRAIKRVVKRKRPYEGIEGYVPRIAHPACQSFPSLHAASTIAFATALILLGHPWAGAVTLWAMLVAFSRFYLGVHYPSDLLGGMILGLASGFALTAWVTG